MYLSCSCLTYTSVYDVPASTGVRMNAWSSLSYQSFTLVIHHSSLLPLKASNTRSPTSTEPCTPDTARAYHGLLAAVWKKNLLSSLPITEGAGKLLFLLSPAFSPYYSSYSYSPFYLFQFPLHRYSSSQEIRYLFGAPSLLFISSFPSLPPPLLSFPTRVLLM